jgi:hypothetical protein
MATKFLLCILYTTHSYYSVLQRHSNVAILEWFGFPKPCSKSKYSKDWEPVHNEPLPSQDNTIKCEETFIPDRDSNSLSQRSGAPWLRRHRDQCWCPLLALTLRVGKERMGKPEHGVSLQHEAVRSRNTVSLLQRRALRLSYNSNPISWLIRHDHAFSAHQEIPLWIWKSHRYVVKLSQNTPMEAKRGEDV